MLVAIFADIHANRQAFDACCGRRGSMVHSTTYFSATISVTARILSGRSRWSWISLAAAASPCSATMITRSGIRARTSNIEAQVAMEWTRGELGLAERRFLEELPLSLTDGGRLYVHADASDPKRWRYVTSVDVAGRSMMATSADVTFCGHVHRPALNTSATGKVSSFTPVTNSAIQLLPRRRWLAVLGSVGQPRDGNPAAAYAISAHREARTDVLPCALRHSMLRRPRSAPKGCRPGSRIAYRWKVKRGRTIAWTGLSHRRLRPETSITAVWPPCEYCRGGTAMPL